MKINYLFYFCDGIGSVFDSQVIALLDTVKDKCFFKKVYLFAGIRNNNQKKQILERIVDPGIEIIFYKSYPNYPFFNFKKRKSIKNVLYDQRIDFNKTVFHTRGELIAWHLSEILEANYHKQIIPDVRGASIEEIKDFNNFNKIIESLKVYNYKKAIKNLNKFKYISVVSNALKEYLITQYNIDSGKIFITPCLAGKDFRFNEYKREEIRQEFNLSRDDILIVFSSGGTAKWQNHIILFPLAEEGFKILNLSPKIISHKNIINKHVNYTEMPLYLNSADAAIICRDKSIVNKVASPVKFSEYVCCGLPVIANYSIDLINAYINEHKCGLLVDDITDIRMNILNDLKQKDRKRISDSAILNFGVDAIVNQYLQTYSSINNL